MRESTTTAGWPALGGAWQILLLLCLLTAFGVGMDLRKGAEGFQLTIEMATTTSGAGQVFLSGDGGYTAERSKDFKLIGDGQRHTYAIEFPTQSVPPRIRLDPGIGPGAVTLYSIVASTPTGKDKIDGATLTSRLSLLSQLSRSPSAGPSFALVASGDDPFLDFAVTVSGRTRAAIRSIVGAALMLLAGSLAILLVWSNQVRAQKFIAGLSPTRKRVIGLIVACAAVFVSLKLLGLGCERIACSPRGISYGATIFLACVSFAIVGGAAVRLIRLHQHVGGLFASILVGQVVLIVYVYLRSLLWATVPALQVTRTELCILVIPAAWYLWRSAGGRAAGDGRWLAGRWWLMMRLALLASVCIVVADRELPRLAMLSSDPDSHAFFARQLERLGGIYRSQAEWGSEGSGYPAGTAALIFAWASLSARSIVNTLGMLPMLVSLLATLAVAEPVADRIPRLWGRAAVLLTAVSVTAAGLMFPVFTQFAHFEGTGRLLSLGVAAVMILLVGRIVEAEKEQLVVDDWRLALLATATLFCLTVLNPVNLVSAGIVLGGSVIALFFRTRRVSWVPFALPAAVLLLAVDPYYWSLMTGTPSTNKLTLAGDLVRLDLKDMIAGWQQSFARPWGPRLAELARLMPWHTAPTFFACSTALLLGTVALHPGKRNARLLWSLMVASIAIACCIVSALLEPLQRDARFYLLPQYFPLSLAMFKALTIVLLSAYLVAATIERGMARITVLLVALLATYVVFVNVRPAQTMMLAPRHDYCGSMGCVQPSDVDVVRRLENMVGKHQIPLVDGVLPRILVPNQLVKAGNESWVFPTGGSRYLAMADALPVAFFYFQADSDYTTVNYSKHICPTLDRAWLARERIRYVFLPADRANVCLGSMDQLQYSDKVELHSGNTFLIRLRDR